MAITDTIKVYYNERRGTYMLLQGRETFYNEDDILLEWETPEEAMEWSQKNHPNTKLIPLK